MQGSSQDQLPLYESGRNVGIFFGFIKKALSELLKDGRRVSVRLNLSDCIALHIHEPNGEEQEIVTRS